MTTLADLPDDILFLVLTNLDSAREVSALGLSCRRFHHLVSHDGWRIFVRHKFPSLSIPTPAPGQHHAWRQLAESVTWQSRCWDRRSLQFQALLPLDESQRRDGRPGARRGLFMSVVDAHLDVDARQELVVWGAGEDIVARYRERRGYNQVSKTSWHRLDGKDLGLRSGYDDVKSIKVVEYGSRPAIVVGRWNGQLSLLSADPDHFGERIAQFGPAVDSPTEKETISSLDTISIGNRTLLAAASQSSISVYRFQEADGLESDPMTSYDLESTALVSNSGKLRGARWMGRGDTMALALAGSKEPLRYLTLTPSGWSHHAAAKSERLAREFSIKHERTICPSSLTPVRLDPGSKKGTNLLLSSWKDGTIRLQDLRTPSPFDVVYQNNVDPWSNAEALMAYGTERFVAGGVGLGIEIFDFRWSRGYHHTAGLPCLNRTPFPRPNQPFADPVNTDPAGRARCDHVRGLPCHWHGLSRSLYHRPNAKYFLSQSLGAYRNSSVWSLARASDVSPNFYIGISGAVIEANLEQTPDTYPPESCTVVDPNFGFPDWRAAAPPASGYRTRPVVPSLMETGDGYSFKGNDRSILLPALLQYQGPRECTAEESQLRSHHRLDNGYQQVVDFY